MEIEDKERAQIRFGMASVVLLLTLAVAIVATRRPPVAAPFVASNATVPMTAGELPAKDLPRPAPAPGTAIAPQPPTAAPSDKTPAAAWRAPEGAQAGSIASVLATRTECLIISNGCQNCWRTGPSGIACSMPGIACQPKLWGCGEP